MNPRELPTGMAVAGAAVALPAPTIAQALPASRTAWDDAFAHWSPVNAQFDALCDRFNVAEEAWGEAVGPRIDRYFDEYCLNMLMERGHIEGALAMYNTRQSLSGGQQIIV